MGPYVSDLKNLNLKGQHYPYADDTVYDKNNASIMHVDINKDLKSLEQYSVSKQTNKKCYKLINKREINKVKYLGM